MSESRLVVIPRPGEQSKRLSFIETLVRATFNYCTALAIQLTLLPALFHARLPLTQNLGIGLVFMANSVAGGYVIRRLFNRVRP